TIIKVMKNGYAFASSHYDDVFVPFEVQVRLVKSGPTVLPIPMATGTRPIPYVGDKIWFRAVEGRLGPRAVIWGFDPDTERGQQCLAQIPPEAEAGFVESGLETLGAVRVLRPKGEARVHARRHQHRYRRRASSA